MQAAASVPLQVLVNDCPPGADTYARSALWVLLLAGMGIMGCTAGNRHGAVNVSPYPIGADPYSTEFQAARKRDFSNEEHNVGIRYYERAPYVLIYSNGKGGIEAKYMMLPDTTKKSTIHPVVLTSTLDTTLEFENGTLKSSKETADATAVPSKIIDQVTQLIPEIVKILPFDRASAVEAVEFPAPYLFKIVAQGNTLTLRGSQGDVGLLITKQ